MSSDRTGYYGWQQGTIQITVCVYCKHKHEDATCEAFPDGIPDEVLAMENDHSEPIDGDHGIQFEPAYEGQKPVRFNK